MEINDWSDLSKLDNMDTIILDEEVEFDKDNCDNNEDQENENEKEGTGKKALAENTKQQEKKSGGGQNYKDFGEVTDWNDLRIFDDDHDDDWFKVQEKKLAKQYGGNFIRVKYADHGRVVYFCELCVAECNAKKSLELHCNGMKHLKKKDLWEKEGRPPPQIGLKNTNTEPANANNSNKWNQPSKKNKKEKEPYNYNRKRSHSRERMRESRPWYPDSRKSRSRSPRSRSPYRERSWERSRSRGKDRNHSSFSRSRLDDDPWPAATSRYPQHSDSGRSKRSPVFSRLSPAGRSRDYIGNDSYSSRDREKDRRYPSPPSRIHSFGSGGDDTPMAPSPPQFGSSDLGLEKSGLSSTPAGTLVQKLAECCVKSSEDAELAINVVASLCKSLKEYSHRIGETKIAELIMDAELKIGTVKALKVGMKILNSFWDTNKSSADSQKLDFLTTLTRNHAEGREQQSMTGMLPSTSGQNVNNAPVTYPVNPYLNQPNPMNNPPPPYFYNQNM